MEREYMKAELSLELVFAEWIVRMAKYCSTSMWTLELNRLHRLLPGNLLLSFLSLVRISLQKSKVLRFELKNIKEYFSSQLFYYLITGFVERFFFYFLVSTWFPLPEPARQFTLIPLRKHSTELCNPASCSHGISLAQYLHLFSPCNTLKNVHTLNTLNNALKNADKKNFWWVLHIYMYIYA